MIFFLKFDRSVAKLAKIVIFKLLMAYFDCFADPVSNLLVFTLLLLRLVDCMVITNEDKRRTR